MPFVNDTATTKTHENADDDIVDDVRAFDSFFLFRNSKASESCRMEKSFFPPNGTHTHMLSEMFFFLFSVWLAVHSDWAPCVLLEHYLTFKFLALCFYVSDVTCLGRVSR